MTPPPTLINRDLCLSAQPSTPITLSAIDILWVYITLLGNRHLPKIELQPCHLTLPWPHVSGTHASPLQTTRHCSMLVSLPPVLKAMLSSHKKATFVTWLLCPPYLWLRACDREKKKGSERSKGAMPLHVFPSWSTSLLLHKPFLQE